MSGASSQPSVWTHPLRPLDWIQTRVQPRSLWDAKGEIDTQKGQARVPASTFFADLIRYVRACAVLLDKVDALHATPKSSTDSVWEASWSRAWFWFGGGGGWAAFFHSCRRSQDGAFLREFKLAAVFSTHSELGTVSYDLTWW